MPLPRARRAPLPPALVRGVAERSEGRGECMKHDPELPQSWLPVSVIHDSPLLKAGAEGGCAAVLRPAGAICAVILSERSESKNLSRNESV